MCFFLMVNCGEPWIDYRSHRKRKFLSNFGCRKTKTSFIINKLSTRNFFACFQLNWNCVVILHATQKWKIKKFNFFLSSFTLLYLFVDYDEFSKWLNGLLIMVCSEKFEKWLKLEICEYFEKYSVEWIVCLRKHRKTQSNSRQGRV